MENTMSSVFDSVGSQFGVHRDTVRYHLARTPLPRTEWNDKGKVLEALKGSEIGKHPENKTPRKKVAMKSKSSKKAAKKIKKNIKRAAPTYRLPTGLSEELKLSSYRIRSVLDRENFHGPYDRAEIIGFLSDKGVKQATRKLKSIRKSNGESDDNGGNGPVVSIQTIAAMINTAHKWIDRNKRPSELDLAHQTILRIHDKIHGKDTQ